MNGPDQKTHVTNIRMHEKEQKIELLVDVINVLIGVPLSYIRQNFVVLLTTFYMSILLFRRVIYYSSNTFSPCVFQAMTSIADFFVQNLRL